MIARPNREFASLPIDAALEKALAKAKKRAGRQMMPEQSEYATAWKVTEQTMDALQIQIVRQNLSGKFSPSGNSAGDFAA